MGTSNPPNGWAIISGTWGDDVDQDTSQTGTTGGFCMKFLETAVSPVRLDYQLIPAAPGQPMLAFYRFMAHENGANQKVSADILWYDEDKNFDSSTTVYFSPVDTVDTWQTEMMIVTCPTDCAFAAPSFTRTNAGAGDEYFAYLDYAGVIPITRSFRAFQDGNTAYASGSVVEFDAEEFDYVGMYDNAADYDWTCPASGVWVLQSGAVNNSDLDTDNYADLIMYWSDDDWTSSDVLAYGTKPHAPSDDYQVHMLCGYIGYFNRGDKVKVYFYHGNGGNLTLLGTAAGIHTWFSGFELGQR